MSSRASSGSALLACLASWCLASVAFAQPPDAGVETAAGAEPALEPEPTPEEEDTSPPPPVEPEPPAPAPNQDGPAEAGDDDDDDEDDDHEPGFVIAPTGFIRTGYEYVLDDPRYDFVGDNSGFILGNARLGVRGAAPAYGISFVITVDGAVAAHSLANTPQADLAVALRDALIRWDFVDFLGVTVGQFKIPFMAGWMGADGALPFASRAVGLDGVPVGRGFETPGIVVDRELGLSVGSNGPVFVAGDFGLGYYATVFNGNGIDQLLNDNVAPAVAGRLELYWTRDVRVGGAVMWNARTVGSLPDRFEEQDLGVSADITARFVGIELYGHFTMMTTSFVTTGAQDRMRLEVHGSAGYDLPFIDFPFVIAYRFAYYDPWQSGGGGGPVDLGAFELMYHTVGLRVEHPVDDIRLTGWLNYTFTVETDARSLLNDRLEVIVQLAF
ncbi:MAG: porin [Sandaracinaceae bacterium]